MLWAKDYPGDENTFRIRIWWEEDNGTEHAVYDNGFDQALGGDNIKIHKGN